MMRNLSVKNIQGWIKAISILMLLVSLGISLYAQPGLPPDHGNNGNQGAGGMAPLGEGLVFLFLGAFLYGFKKFRSSRKRKD